MNEIEVEDCAALSIRMESGALVTSSVTLGAAGNISRTSGAGAVDLDGCEGVFALTDGPRISAVGLKDVCIIISGSEVLVTSREGAQRVGKLPGASTP